ncbi:MAG: hypothetical protein P1U77_16145 [Rubripirellula sp.]|nr:hypothetical protein [Rubripirellula sp.]
MITSHQSFRTASVATLLAAGMIFQIVSVHAGSPSQQASVPRDGGNRQVAVNRLRPQEAKQPARRQSVIAQAATGELIDELPQPPLDGSLVQVAQVDHLQYAAPCGPVCDCGDCMTEVACGAELMPGAGRGFEIGCGIGSLVDNINSWSGSQCCDDGCDQCCDGIGILEEGCGIDQIVVEGPGCGMDGLDVCDCGACSSCEVDCIPLFLPMLRVQWHRFDFFAGHQGFKGPLNFANTAANERNGSGSFGFYQGFNHGRSLRRWCRGWDVATQFGVRTTQSNLSGAEFTGDRRNQVFVTAGFFRRVDYGLQYGIVVDYLNQDWYFNGNLTQLRGELSWRCQNNCHIGGFQFMSSLSSDTSATTVRDQANAVFNSTVSYESTDQYRFFYRRLLKHNGQWSAFAGWTNQEDTLLGSDFSLPIMRRLALAGGVTYQIPGEGTSNGGNEQEGWNLSLGVVFRPGGHNGAGRYSRPLFDVADNGTFLVDRK